MKPGRKDRLHENARDEIKSIALDHISRSGASALSLGAIARAMALTTPALYRYFPSRNHLVTALIEDAYASFIAALEKARDSLPPDDHAGRFRVLCLAYHDWAAAHPQQYLLIFGDPVPGYKLDARVGELADRSFLILLELINAAVGARKIGVAPARISVTTGLKAQLDSVKHQGNSYPSRVMYLALSSWSFIHGITSLEIYKHNSLILGDKTREFFQLEVNRFMESIGFK